MKKILISILIVFLILLVSCKTSKPLMEEDDWGVGWDDIISSSYDDIEYLEDVFYDFCVFDSNILSVESVEVVTVEYKDVETFFDKDKIYTKLGLKLNPETLLTKYAIGTGVIVVCLALNVATYGGSSTICCIIAGAANGAITGAASGAIVGGIIGAISKYISSDGDWIETGVGSIEGAIEGYMWGAVFGAISGAITSDYCFTGETLVYTSKGLIPISTVAVGDYVYAINIESGEKELSIVDEVLLNKTGELIEIYFGNQSFRCTPYHPILTNNGWKYALEITNSDYIVSYSNEYFLVDSTDVIFLSEEENVYNLNVRGAHTYCITDKKIVAHNVCINNEYAGKTYKYESIKQQYLDTGDEKYLKLYNTLLDKYPNGVPFSELDAFGNTFPDFSEYVLWEYKFPPVNAGNIKAGTCLIGDSSAGSADFKLFRQKMLENGYTKSQISDILSRYTIHHAPDCQTLQLIPRDLHQAVRHKGGASLIRQIIANL